MKNAMNLTAHLAALSLMALASSAKAQDVSVFQVLDPASGAWRDVPGRQAGLILRYDSISPADKRTYRIGQTRVEVESRIVPQWEKQGCGVKPYGSSWNDLPNQPQRDWIAVPFGSSTTNIFAGQVYNDWRPNPVVPPLPWDSGAAWRRPPKPPSPPHRDHAAKPPCPTYARDNPWRMLGLTPPPRPGSPPDAVNKFKPGPPPAATPRFDPRLPDFGSRRIAPPPKPNPPRFSAPSAPPRTFSRPAPAVRVPHFSPPKSFTPPSPSVRMPHFSPPKSFTPPAPSVRTPSFSMPKTHMPPMPRPR